MTSCWNNSVIRSWLYPFKNLQLTFKKNFLLSAAKTFQIRISYWNHKLDNVMSIFWNFDDIDTFFVCVAENSKVSHKILHRTTIKPFTFNNLVVPYSLIFKKNIGFKKSVSRKIYGRLISTQSLLRSVSHKKL